MDIHKVSNLRIETIRELRLSIDTLSNELRYAERLIDAKPRIYFSGRIRYLTDKLINEFDELCSAADKEEEQKWI